MENNRAKPSKHDIAASNRQSDKEVLKTLKAGGWVDMNAASRAITARDEEWNMENSTRAEAQIHSHTPLAHTPDEKKANEELFDQLSREDIRIIQLIASGTSPAAISRDTKLTTATIQRRYGKYERMGKKLTGENEEFNPLHVVLKEMVVRKLIKAETIDTTAVRLSEIQLLQAFSIGLTPKIICEKFPMSPEDFQRIIKKIYSWYDVKNMDQLAARTAATFPDLDPRLFYDELRNG